MKFYKIILGIKMEITVKDVKWPKTLFKCDEKRESGLHLSTIIKSLQESSGIGYKGKGFSDIELTAEIGLLWEDILSLIMGEKYAMRPPQINVDGIWMSPDGIGPDPDGEVPIVIEEYKATWQSTNRSPIDNFYYMCQLKSYCRAIETKIAVMHIFYIMGNYKGSGPVYRVARIKFSQYELDQNWNMVLKHKKEMENSGNND